MNLRFANTISNEKELIGGSLQGTLLGGINYIIASNNVDVEDNEPISSINGILINVAYINGCKCIMT